MGTFLGHVLPAVCLMVWAIWTGIHLFYRYFTSATFNKKNSFVSSTYFPLKKSRLVPLDVAVKFIGPLIGIIGETVTGFRGGQFVNVGNGQHIIMYGAFGLHGFIELLQICRVPFPADLSLEYVSLALAYGVEGLLFLFHLHGRPHLDVHIHTLLVYVIGLCTVATILEITHRKSLLVAMIRVYGTFLQGVWFLIIALVLYNPNPNAAKWDLDSHEQIMIMTIIFTATATLLLVAMMTLCLVVRFYANRSGAPPMNGYERASSSDDSDLSLAHLITDLN